MEENLEYPRERRGVSRLAGCRLYHRAIGERLPPFALRAFALAICGLAALRLLHGGCTGSVSFQGSPARNPGDHVCQFPIPPCRDSGSFLSRNSFDWWPRGASAVSLAG